MASAAGSNDSIVIRKAEASDCNQVFKYIVELCVYLKSEKAMTLTAEDFYNDIFGDNPACHCLVATEKEDPSTVIGYTLYYKIYSPWVGRSIYMEDLYVAEAHRGRGVGTLLWKRVTQIGLDSGCRGMRLTVENWNKFAKDMYVRHGFVDLVESAEEHLMFLNKTGMENLVKGV